MKLLFMTGSIYPTLGQNANLLCRLIPFLLQKHEVCMLSYTSAANEADLPRSFKGVPIFWASSAKCSGNQRIIHTAMAKLVDRSGYSDYYQAKLLQNAAERLWNEYPFDAVIATTEPFIAALSCAYIRKKVKKILYIMDPPECTYGNPGTPFRNRTLPRILERQTRIVTTPFIWEALQNCGYGSLAPRFSTVGFPMLQAHETHASTIIKKEPGKIDLLFCGWLYSDIRSPRYFLELVSRLDERYRIYFMGKECEQLLERFPLATRAQLITLPQQPYQAALDAMEAADVLINIGNSVPVHMPSKVLEYINTGKPMVNFYKLPDCPSLFYTRRYPLCLNLFEGNADLAGATKQLEAFCLQAKGKTVERTQLAQAFYDCTPHYIAESILGDHYV